MKNVILLLVLIIPIINGLSIQNIIADYMHFTPKPPPVEEAAKLARFVMHYSGNFLLK